MHDSKNAAHITIPVMEEQMLVDREVSETGAVRVRIKPELDHQLVDVPVRHTGYRVDRVQRGAPVTARRDPWYEGDVVVVPIYEEVLIKQLVLREEMRLVPTTDATHEQRDVELVHERLILERRDAQGQWHEVAIENASS